MDRDDPSYAGQRDYSRLLLNAYDHLVLGPIARFGASVLGTSGRHTWAARRMLGVLNRQGGFDNLDDSEEGLHEILSASFEHVELETIGSIAIFAATNPRVSAG